ncbi:MAG: hypothetical protein JWM43_3774 [Acidobacteriaceae bacterium]|nr:hypothetical protein [Acidobacteriaceae bacterium]
MKYLATVLALAGCTVTPLFAQNGKSNIAPGARTQILAHNAYPDHGKYADRLDRAIASGMPFAIEEDLACVNGRSVVIHGAKNVSPDDPTLESYFFPRVAPMMEQALKE